MDATMKKYQTLYPNFSFNSLLKILLLISISLVLGCNTGQKSQSKTKTPVLKTIVLKTTVIKDDRKKPKGCSKLLAYHAFNECRKKTWHVITKGSYRCGNTQIIKEVHVIRTNQPCKPGALAPSIQDTVSFGVPIPCSSPKIIWSFYNLACPNDAFWNWMAYDRMQCANGKMYVRRNPSADRITKTICTKPPPDGPSF